MGTQRYPLAWPVGWQRTPGQRRKRARFEQKVERAYTTGTETKYYKQGAALSVYAATLRLTTELTRLGAREPVISTNLVLRLDGLPRSDQREPADPGVAVYFKLAGKPRTLACDRWDRVADNLAAVAAHIHAIRAVDRYGVGTLEQAFAGYAQLSTGSPPEEWWKVLECEPDAPLDEVERQFRKFSRLAHPDMPGGSHAAMTRLTEARERARQERT